MDIVWSIGYIIIYWNCEGLLDFDWFFHGKIGPKIVTGFSLNLFRVRL